MQVGTDIISIERIRQAVAKQPRFCERILSPSELERYEQYSSQRRMEFLAGRFSAKEAYVKALQTGIGKIKFTDISIIANANGAPVLEYAPVTRGVHLSISHCQEYATATVIITLSETDLQDELDRFEGSEHHEQTE